MTSEVGGSKPTGTNSSAVTTGSILRYRFTHCVRASVTSAVPAAVWSRSLDDRLTRLEPGHTPFTTD
ncbi:YxiG-like protein [Actinokineospora sp. 24-640]